jgi:hypothetical protein
MTSERADTFAVEGGALIRRVVPRRGSPYEHACTEQVYKDVAFAIEEMGAASFTGEIIRERIDAPSSQVMTALAFLKERGCIVPARERRHRAASDFVYEDALIELHALREGSPGSR